jgi:putative sigma-54 modulation protein
MDVKIHAIHFHADQRLENFIREKIGKIETFFDKITGTEVYLKLENNGSQIKDKVAEIKVMMPGKVIYSAERSKLFEESFDSALTGIMKQVKRHKEKLKG